MAKIRVYELARELGIESKALVAKLRDMKIDVSSHQSTLSATHADKIRATLSGEKPKVVVVRRRRKVAAVEPEDTELSEELPEESQASDASLGEPSEAASPPAPVSELTEEPPAPAKEQSTKSVTAEKTSRDKTAEDVSSADVLPSEMALQEQKKKLEELFDKPRSFIPPKQEKKEAPAKDSGGKGPGKKSVYSATVVRRATPEEEQAAKRFKEEKKSRASVGTKRSDSASGAYGGSAASGASPFKAGTGTGEERNVRGRSGRESEADAQRASQPRAGNKRRAALSTKELLDALGSGVYEERESLSVRRRTVYTPSGPQKRKDLKRRRDLKSTKITTPRAAYRVVKMASSTITVGELAKQLAVKLGEVIKKLMDQGIMATANQAIDFDTASLVAAEYNFEVKNVERSIEDILQLKDEEAGAEIVTRPPIVTVMGHVDHGKTTVLDVIRKSDVANGEAGGITQHIGAYTVDHDGFKIAFLDTPGHEAFSAMRARGAELTDIVVLVVAADDGVMPQTVEAIAHARDAKVPLIVAINKIDKPNINVDRIYTELSEQGVQAEEWGGDVQCVKISAKNNVGIDTLLEAIQLQTEMLELKTRFTGRAEGMVIEANLSKGLGAIATIMVSKGTLTTGDLVVAGRATGKVRALTDHNGKSVRSATPSTPVEVIGLTAVPMSGDYVCVCKDDKMARDAVEYLLEHERAAAAKAQASDQQQPSLEELLTRAEAGDRPELPLIIKADTQGSAEALAQSITNLQSKKVNTKIVAKGVGDVNESDISLAAASESAILAFNVRISRGLSERADKQGVLVTPSKIIYEILETVKSLMVDRLPTIKNEVVQGHAEVRDTISVPKVGIVAGSSVLDGKISRNSHLRVIRDSEVIFDGKIGSLKRFKDDVKEVQNGYECGISIDGYNDIKIGDVLEAYLIEEVAPQLDV